MARNNMDDDDDDDLFAALQSMEPCGNCGAEGAKIPCMSGCGEVFYCSKECGMHHAAAHRLRCRNLRCPDFNEEDGESSSEEEISDYDSDEYEEETDSGDDDDDDDDDDYQDRKKSVTKKKRGKRRGKSGAAKGGGVMVDAEIEKRIEEKIMKRIKQQEENRIAQAIEQRMRQEKAGWGGDDMMRFMMELRDRFANEMSSSQFMAQVKKRGDGAGGADMMGLLQSMMSAMPPPSADANPQNPRERSDEKEAVGADGERARSASKESSWNNACREFAALRVVVWKLTFLPKMEFVENPKTGIWNMLKELDSDESFSHICEGDALLSVNGRVVDEAIKTDDDMKDFLGGFASPLILKFEAADPDNGKVHDYAVTWSNGPLGVTLKDDATNQKVPIVNRLTKKPGSVAVKQNIAIGDILVAINNIDTIQLGCSLSMSILKKVQLPAKLRFRGVGGPAPDAGESDAAQPAERVSMSSLGNMARPSTYEINWGEGPLGLTIIPGMNANDLPVIKKVTGTGTSPGIEKAQIGDLLETMNGKETANLPFDQVVAFLKATPKPILLRFKVAGEFSTPSSLAPASSPAKPSQESRTPSPRPSKPTPPPAAAASEPPPPPVFQLPPMGPDEYHIVWGDGQLGLTIDANKQTSGSYIKRIGDTGAAANLSKDCVGDYLTFINERDVGKAPFKEIVDLLKNVPRPVTLRFRRKQRSENYLSQSTSSMGSEASAHQNPHRMSDSPARGRKPSAHEANGIYYYNVVWQAGTPLGLSLRGADSTSEYPFITRVTGSGSAAHLPSNVVNDCLISIDGRSVHKRDKTFDEVMAMLKNMPKPITLKFQTRNDSNAAQAQQFQPQQQPQQFQQQPPPQYQQQHQPPPQYQQQQAPPPQQRQQQMPPQQRQQQPPPQQRMQQPPPQQRMQQPPPQQRMQQPPQFSASASNVNMHASQPPPAQGAPLQQGSSWRQNRSMGPGGPSGGNPGLAYQGSSLPMPRNPLAAPSRQASGLSRSFVTQNEPAHGLNMAAGHDDKFSSIQAPFLAQSQISTTRRKKMLKGLKK